MAFAGIFFYIFAGVAIGAATMVIVARNPVHCVLFLILAFFNGAGLFVLLGAEFLAMILVVVYVGAVAVLFLFVVMMLDIDFTEMRRGILEYLPIGLVLGLVLLVELSMVFFSHHIEPNLKGAAVDGVISTGLISNTQALGEVLYTRYVYFFQMAGMILLVAMIGAIVLTLRHKKGVKRQDIGAQVARSPETAIEVINVKPGRGI